MDMRLLIIIIYAPRISWQTIKIVESIWNKPQVPSRRNWQTDMIYILQHNFGASLRYDIISGVVCLGVV